MGISNFVKLFNIYQDDDDLSLDGFDSILVDVQSLIYIAIEKVLDPTHLESQFIRSLCADVVQQIIHILRQIFDFCRIDGTVTVVISFDGEAVPMKWPTQRNRRSASDIFTGKNLYRNVLFGNNTISNQISRFLIETLQSKEFHGQFSCRNDLQFIVSGCDVEGEGEHKMFQIAEASGCCKNPVIVSVDNDVFILAMARMNEYDNVRIFKNRRIYDIGKFIRDIPYPATYLIIASFLFGNDFVPPVVAITDSNKYVIHDAITENCRSSYLDDDWPSFFTRFLNAVRKHLRFTPTPSIDRTFIVDFWKTCLWINDYYRRRYFDQKYMTNTVWDVFDRNMLVTALLDENVSTESFSEARTLYETLSTEKLPFETAVRRVFSNERVLLKYLMTSEEENAECCIITVTKTT